MNPSSKGWLEEYYSFYKTENKDSLSIEDSSGFIYDLLFDTSLLFSVPFGSSNVVHPEFSKWNFKERLKIIFTHCLFKISDLYIQDNKFILETKEIAYRLAQAESSELPIEEYIDLLMEGKRVSFLLNTYNANPWAFLYLVDFYFFLKKEPLDVYRIKIDIIKSMYKVSQSKKNISDNEERLINKFIENGNFAKDDKEILYKYARITAYDSDFSQQPRIVKKLSYDLALFTIMTDNLIDEAELVAINKMSDRLEIPIHEQHKTFSLIQNIHLNYYKQLAHFHKTYSFYSIKNIVNHNFKYILKKNSAMIVNEIRESKELLALLRKSTDKRLSDEEKEKVKAQILDLLKTIPSLTIFMIPGGSILLPIIMKIIPREILFPSSFLNKKNR